MEFLAHSACTITTGISNFTALHSRTQITPCLCLQLTSYSISLSGNPLPIKVSHWWAASQVQMLWGSCLAWGRRLTLNTLIIISYLCISQYTMATFDIMVCYACTSSLSNYCICWVLLHDHPLWHNQVVCSTCVHCYPFVFLIIFILAILFCAIIGTIQW